MKCCMDVQGWNSRATALIEMQEAILSFLGR